MGFRVSGTPFAKFGERVEGVIVQYERVMLDEAKDIIGESVVEGADLQADILDKTTSPYGRRRYDYGLGKYGGGNSAGRNDSGNMIESITSDVQAYNNRVDGFWGWEELDPHENRYFGIQENQVGSLFASFTPTKEDFFRKFLRAVKR